MAIIDDNAKIREAINSGIYDHFDINGEPDGNIVYSKSKILELLADSDKVHQPEEIDINDPVVDETTRSFASVRRLTGIEEQIGFAESHLYQAGAMLRDLQRAIEAKTLPSDSPENPNAPPVLTTDSITNSINDQRLFMDAGLACAAALAPINIDQAIMSGFKIDNHQGSAIFNFIREWKYYTGQKVRPAPEE